MNEFIKLFKKGIPREKKLYQAYMLDCKIHNFSYEKFKNTNIALIEIKDYIEKLDEYYSFSQKQIDNIFEYLKQNIRIDKFTKLKKIFKQLNELSENLSKKYNSNNILHGESSRKNCLYIIDKIEELKSDLSKRCGRVLIDVEKTIQFENIVNKILNPKELIFDGITLLFIIDN